MEETVTTEGMPAAAPQENPQGKKKKLIIACIIVALVLIGGGGALAFFMNGTSDAEQMAYEVLENNDNPQDYKDFLEKYPDSPRADEVRNRLEVLEAMLQKWNSIVLSDNVRDFIDFKNSYTNPRLTRICDIKIDSLDFVKAQTVGTEEAYQQYLSTHPDGRYASEASIAQGNLRDMEITPEDRDRIITVVSDFFQGFETQNEAAVCANITATMKTFLHQKDATKATVIQTIKGMFNEHILSCQFTVNRDIEITRAPGSNGNFTATFTVDQHIERDNEGKTFGSYRCVAELTPQMLITSLTMDELSKR